MAYLSTVNAIPAMTSNTAPSGIASASSENGSYQAWKAFDKVTGVYGWTSTATTAWIKYEFPKPIAIKKYSLKSDQYPNRTPKNWTFEGSNDGSNWIVIDTIVGQTAWGVNAVRTFETNNTTQYKMYRINVTANNGDTASVSIDEIEMFEIVYEYKALLQSNSKAYSTQNNLDKYGVAQYKFEDRDTTITDSVGRNHGTATNATFVEGVNGGKAISFAGSGKVQFSNSVIPLGKKSIRFKVKTTQATTNGGIFLTDGINPSTSSSVSYGFYFGVHNNKLFIIYYRGTTTTRTDIYSNKTINDGQWHDILFTWDGTTNADAVKIYIDDMKTPDITGTYPTIDTTAHSANLTMGCSSNTQYPGWYTGYLTDVEIYNDVINVDDCKLISIESASESDYISYGKKNVEFNSEFNGEIVKKRSTVTLGSGKTFEHTIDLSKRRVDKINLN